MRKAGGGGIGHHGGLAGLLSVLVLLALGGCSLISLKTPERPLSSRDLNARILAHEFSGRFISGVADAADVIAAGADTPAVRSDALRWKISASVASENAATEMAPFVALLDTWALSEQMADFLRDGAGRELFGPQQSVAVERATELAGEAKSLVERLSTAEEFERARVAVNRYVRQYPFSSVAFGRPSIASLWAEGGGSKAPLADTLGTVPEALGNLGDVVRIYGANGSSQLVWNAQLAAQQSGISSADVAAAMRRLDERVQQLTELANAAPQRFEVLMGTLRGDVGRSLAEVDHAIHAEQADFFAKLNAERDAAFREIDTQRAALAADAAHIAGGAIKTAGEEARRLVRDTLLSAALLALVVLGLPFAAGYWLGRARAKT